MPKSAGLLDAFQLPDAYTGEDIAQNTEQMFGDLQQAPFSPQNKSLNYHDVLTGGAQPDWDAYRAAVGKYLSRPVFAGTPLSADMFVNSAKDVYDRTGTYVPYDLALAQGQLESSMGRKGRNPTTNPFNVGEFDEGTKMRFKTPDEGVMAYYNLMANDYLKNRTRDDLLHDKFVNSAGNRYASNPQYEDTLRKQSQFILGFSR